MREGLFHEEEPLNPLTGRVIGAAIAVHRALGPGLLEATYERCLVAELEMQGLNVSRQVPVSLTYRNVHIDCGYRMDMLVENQVVVELKSVATFAPVHISQVLTYLRLSGLRVGLLINFNVETLTAGGIRRVLRSNSKESTVKRNARVTGDPGKSGRGREWK